jgi:hypothetical protein
MDFAFFAAEARDGMEVSEAEMEERGCDWVVTWKSRFWKGCLFSNGMTGEERIGRTLVVVVYF